MINKHERKKVFMAPQRTQEIERTMLEELLPERRRFFRRSRNRSSCKLLSIVK